MCSGLTVSKMPNYGLNQPVATYSSFRCLDPALAISESAVSVGSSGYTSGGGFSRYFTRSSYATWQESAVNRYLSGTGTKPSSQYFNSSGRAIPDVAMYGGLFPVVLGGTINFAAGTSLSSPLFAAVIALLNQQTLDAKGATIGWANPLLYAMARGTPAAFTDITSGSNRCPAPTRNGPACASTCQGYSATTGWDPVTGLGVPNVGQMQAALAQYLLYAQVTHTGSVTGITGAAYSGAASTSSLSAPLALLLLVIVPLLPLLL